MMNRQAYFYRVPPQELHRRNQLQADPTKTKALQTVIDMKVGLPHTSEQPTTRHPELVPYRCTHTHTHTQPGPLSHPYTHQNSLVIDTAMIKDMLSVDLPLIWNPHTDLSYYNVLQASSSPRL